MLAKSVQTKSSKNRHPITSGPRNRAIYSRVIGADPARPEWVPGYDPRIPADPPSCGNDCGGESTGIMDSIWQQWPGQFLF
jgi:hypothetical protein